MAGRQSDDVVDVADTTPRKAVDTSGKRVQAIPGFDGTTVVIRDVDFAAHGIDHPTVTWDWQVDDFTVRVGPLLSEEAADFLVTKVPEQFKIYKA